MKWIFSKITRTFSGLLLLNFMILVCVTMGAYSYSIQQLEENNVMLLRLTNQKTAAREIWNDLQETNIEIQEALLKETPASLGLSNDLKRTKQDLEHLAHTYPSPETDSYSKTAMVLIQYYEKILIPLTENRQSANRYTDFTAMRRMLKDASFVIPLQSTLSGQNVLHSIPCIFFRRPDKQRINISTLFIHWKKEHSRHLPIRCERPFGKR